MTDDSVMHDLGRQIDAVGERSRRQFDPGMRAVFVAVGVLVLLGAVALPFAGGAQGWQVLVGQGDRNPSGGAAAIMPVVFLGLSLLFGAAGSLVALAVRRYGAAWAVSLGCDLSALSGAMAIWSQQTGPSKAPGPGPGVGMVLALAAMVLLALLWASITWGRRPDEQRYDEMRSNAQRPDADRPGTGGQPPEQSPDQR